MQVTRERSDKGWSALQLQTVGLDHKLKDGRCLGDLTLREWTTKVARLRGTTPDVACKQQIQEVNRVNWGEARRVWVNQPSDSAKEKQIVQWIGEAAIRQDPRLAEVSELARESWLEAWEAVFGQDAEVLGEVEVW